MNIPVSRHSSPPPFSTGLIHAYPACADGPLWAVKFDHLYDVGISDGGMAGARQLYGRLDRWVRNLSRIEYALFAGSISLISQLIIDILLTELQLLDAVITALIITTVFYLLSGVVPRN